MTEPVKFPNTDIEAPKNIEAFINSGRKSWVNPENEWTTRGVNYLRADTATPNDEVYQMMLECAEMGVNRDDKPTRIVDEVFNRYATNSNHVR